MSGDLHAPLVEPIAGRPAQNQLLCDAVCVARRRVSRLRRSRSASPPAPSHSEGHRHLRLYPAAPKSAIVLCGREVPGPGAGAHRSRAADATRADRAPFLRLLSARPRRRRPGDRAAPGDGQPRRTSTRTSGWLEMFVVHSPRPTPRLQARQGPERQDPCRHRRLERTLPPFRPHQDREEIPAKANRPTLQIHGTSNSANTPFGPVLLVAPRGGLAVVWHHRQ